jgi:hypothetical protein
MPAPQSQEARRGKLVQGLLWGGVGLAPLAVLILLFGQSTGSLRVAVILAVLTIVMIAVSIALRPGVEMVRVDIEHRVLDEMERVRMHTRDDISTASRNTHRALVERIQVLTATVEDLRGQMEEVHAVAMLPPSSPVPGHQAPGAPGMVRRTETVHVTRRTTMVGGEEDGSHTGTVYGVKPAVDGEWRERPDRRDERVEDRHGDRPDRHGEDRHGEDRHGDDRHAEDRHREPRADRVERDGRGEWDGVAAGDRWASVRADDHGREYRVGERRASVRSDGRGTEMRVEDRWAALRREESSERRDSQHGESEWESTFRSLSQRPDSVRALPAAPGEPPGRYLDDGHRDERHRDERHRDEHDRVAEPVRSRGRERARDRERDWESERGRGYEDHRPHEDGRHDDPRRDDARRDQHDRRPEDRRPEGHRPERRHQERPEERYEDDRYHEERRRQERLPDRHPEDHRDDRHRGDRYDDRGRDPRGHDGGHDERGRDPRGHDSGYGDRGHDGGYGDRHDGRGHDSHGYGDRDDRAYPRPRSPHPSEYDR